MKSEELPIDANLHQARFVLAITWRWSEGRRDRSSQRWSMKKITIEFIYTSKW